MKKYLISLVALFLLSAAPVFAEAKIAVIDLQRVFTEYYKTKEADVRLKEILTNFQKDYQDMLADYQKMVDEATKLRDDANNTTLSKEVRDDKNKALQLKVQDVKAMERKLQEFDVTRRKQLDDQSARMRKGIVDEITKVIADLGARDKYNLIFDKSGVGISGTASVLYADGLKDITDDVIKTMNASKPLTTTPTSSTTPSVTDTVTVPPTTTTASAPAKPKP